MLCGKFQEMMSRLCIRMPVGKLLATPDQGEQLIFPGLRAWHDVAISLDCLWSFFGPANDLSSASRR
jgi:hypothetical protein